MSELGIDEVLTTTRAVRRRLDLERPVPRAVIEECLELAFQAPNGSNQQFWQWIFVEDPATKAAMADLYRAGMDAHIARPRTGAEPQIDYSTAEAQRISASVAHLREHLQEVPVLLVAGVAGRLDDSPIFEQASRWGSILPGVWSFMLALRSRGLGERVDDHPPPQGTGDGRAARHPLRPGHPGRAVPRRLHDRHRLQAREPGDVERQRPLEPLVSRRALEAASEPSATRRSRSGT